MRRSVRFLTLLALLLACTLPASEPENCQLLSPEETLKLLAGYHGDAIQIGEGDKPVYTFIDPLCSMSQQYLQFLYANKERMFKQYTIHLFLLHLNGKPSEAHIATILGSEYPVTMLKTVMIDHQGIITEEADVDIEERIERIETIAKQIGVFKRPYIIMNGKVI